MHKSSLLILTVFAVAACSKETPSPEPVRPVKTQRIAYAAAPDSLLLAGEVRARFEAPLAFQVGGRVVERAVNLGELVRRGQVLGRLDASDYRLAEDAQNAALAGARTELQLAEGDLARYRALREKGFISAAEMDRHQAVADGARARRDAAAASHAERRRQTGYATLTAESDGVVTALDFNVGQVVAVGQPLLKIARPGGREIEVAVPESELARFRAATAFQVNLNAMPGQNYSGKLRELAAAADPATRAYAARIAVDGLPESLGLSATVRPLGRGGQVVRLPLAAVVSRDGTARVWKLDQATSTVHAATVTSAGVSGDDWLVSGGLAPGELVVTAGANLLREGQQVRVAQGAQP
ncbi:MAG: efflux RND transporter periplasmic adaptor subunit [Betaproteobacteria bacterium]|nr:MAG: efflux RND transporter periplasmic adaptor subunit [Betaproteobacteria bacterium]